jgi:enoyl-CoA hydratase/carnithine racemase
MQEQAGKADGRVGEPVLLEERRDAIAVLTLNRPAARNSLSDAMLFALQDAIDRLSGDRGVRAVIIAARGPAFCAGHDMKEMTARRSDPDGGKAYFADLIDRCSAVMQSIVRSPKPFIAAVERTATAAGCQLVATCDLAVAADDATFATPGVNIGLFCSTPMVALSRNVPRKRAMEMLLLGEMMSAQDAVLYGLVNRAVPRDQVMAEAAALADKIASKSTATVAIGKETFYRQLDMPLAEAYREASEVMVRNMMYRDAAEGIGAFIDKRQPEWKDS